MHARFLGLLLGVREQRVQFDDQRLHFQRQRIGNGPALTLPVDR
jgi:hypothetical protein